MIENFSDSEIQQHFADREAEELLNLSRSVYSKFPPSARFIAKGALLKEPSNPNCHVQYLKCSIYTTTDCDDIFQDSFDLFESDDKYKPYKTKLNSLYLEYLLFNNRFADSYSFLNKNSEESNNSIEFSFLSKYLFYLKSGDARIFSEVKGVGDHNRESFFALISSFPIRPSDNDIFIDSIKQFFSEETISVYKSYFDVYQNNYSENFDYKNDLFGDVAYKYILDGNLEKGWMQKAYNILPSILDMPFLDTSKISKFENVEGKNILILSEQAYGDNLIYFRMWEKIIRENPKTNFIYLAKPNLHKLFLENLTHSNVKIFSLRDDFNVYKDFPYDIFYPDFFAPIILNLKKNNIENFLKISCSESKPLDKSIGICWSTEIRQNVNKLRNLPLQVFYEKLNLKKYQDEGFKIYSLSHKHLDSDKELMKEYGISDLSDSINNFYDTASYLNSMSKVFTIDTSIYHLSNAMGKDVSCVQNFFKGYQYDKDNGLYPNCNLINLCDEYFDWINSQCGIIE